MTLVGQPVAEAVRPRPLPAPRYRDWHAAGERAALVAVDLAVVLALSCVDGVSWLPLLATVPAFAVAGLYRPRLRYSALDDLPRLLLGVGIVALATVPPQWYWIVAAALAIGRATAYAVVERCRRAAPGAPTLVIGSGEVGIRLAEALGADRAYGLAPIGLVGPPPVQDPALPAPLLGPVDELDRIIDGYRPHRVIVTFSGAPDAALVGTLRRCRQLGIVVYIVPRLFELGLGRTGIELLHGVPLARMRPEPARRWPGAVKRAIDVTGAALGLVLLWPVFAACALAVRWESGRAGVLFRQERIGKDGRPFQILKFRSLTPSSERESQERWNIRDDNRVGPVGRVLRGTSLDELPQLINVLRGDMSLVGPRPERPYFVEEFTRMYDGYPDRHRVPGGITGWAQIHGLRGDTSIEDRLRFDNYYVENWSPALDLKIIARTAGSMLRTRRR